MFRKVYSIPHPLCVTVATRFGEKLLGRFRRKQSEVVFNDPTSIMEITKREMGSLNYLEGYVVISLTNKIKSKKHQGDSELNHQMLLVLQACKIHDISEQKLIACQIREGLNCKC